MARTLTPADDRVRLALVLIMRLTQTHDQQLADRAGMDRRSIQKRRAGKPHPTPISAGEVEIFADALGVPLFLFYESEPDILRWFAERGSSTKGSHSRTWNIASAAA